MELTHTRGGNDRIRHGQHFAPHALRKRDLVESGDIHRCRQTNTADLDERNVDAVDRGSAHDAGN